jgi:hypothetical protein
MRTPTIWKYPLKVGTNEVELPFLHQPVGFGHQEGVGLVMWAEVVPDSPQKPYRFDVIGTGFDVPAGGEHVATVQAHGFVWHLYAFTEEVP